MTEAKVSNPEGVKLYLDYLAKEMNIMGVLTAFSMARLKRRSVHPHLMDRMLTI